MAASAAIRLKVVNCCVHVSVHHRHPDRSGALRLLRRLRPGAARQGQLLAVQITLTT